MLTNSNDNNALNIKTMDAISKCQSVFILSYQLVCVVHFCKTTSEYDICMINSGNKQAL